ncbi:hypothetical protein PGH24_07600 [Thermoanaerobacterium thermosaccharolyticum]|uniref:hypothetical protein n=1 Tax=Thermoanaerobacterium thermosaccharolyticum TaxID=1517 RepID=UPI0027A89BCD|nr:hypothetical protein PGH24_07600 [Thermoanaerobacterium thermosaccharolyticum]
MFIWKTPTILNTIKEHMPQLYSALNVIRENFDSDEIEKVLYEEYSKLESISIDYGITEKAKNAYVVPGDFGWNEFTLVMCWKDEVHNVKRSIAGA